jgi:hypothetical protein
MIINSADIIIELSELRRALDGAVGGADQVREIDVALENGVAVISGKVALGLTIPFKTRWKVGVADEGYALGVTLAGVSVGVMGVGEGMISDRIMAMLAEKLAGHQSVRVADGVIRVDLRAVLAARGVALRAPVRSIEIKPSGVALRI